MRTEHASRWPILLALAALSCLPSCALVYQAVYGDMRVAPEYGKFTGKRVAILCLPNGSVFDSEETCDQIARAVEKYISTKDSKIELVKHDEIANWFDSNEWNDDRTALHVGRAVHADYVVTIELSDYRIHAGPSMFQGHSAWTVNTYNMAQDGKNVFTKSEYDYAYPESHAQHASSISEPAFQRQYTAMVARRIGNYFVSHSQAEDFGLDALAN